VGLDGLGGGQAAPPGSPLSFGSGDGARAFVTVVYWLVFLACSLWAAGQVCFTSLLFWNNFANFSSGDVGWQLFLASLSAFLAYRAWRIIRRLQAPAPSRNYLLDLLCRVVFVYCCIRLAVALGTFLPCLLMRVFCPAPAEWAFALLAAVVAVFAWRQLRGA
jgi:hypothetical protein